MNITLTNTANCCEMVNAISGASHNKASPEHYLNGKPYIYHGK